MKKIYIKGFELEIEYSQSTRPLIWIGEQKVFRDYGNLVAISSKLFSKELSIIYIKITLDQSIPANYRLVIEV